MILLSGMLLLLITLVLPLAVVEEGLEKGVDPLRIRRAARMLQGYELMFWDAVWDASRS